MARSYRLLWIAVKNLPGGEAQLRDMVAAMNDEDGTHADARGTETYSSTKALTDEQFSTLLDRVIAAAGLPKAPRRGSRKRRRLPAEDATRVAFLVSQEELVYLSYLFGLLAWTSEARANFVRRQTKKETVQTHADATRVIEPLERILERKGWVLREDLGVKQWSPPA